MLEMRTVLKKIKPEENFSRYYEMVLRQADGQTIVEKRWGVAVWDIAGEYKKDGTGVPRPTNWP
jgi:hypothetical protein